jgi:hypothetical protein
VRISKEEKNARRREGNGKKLSPSMKRAIAVQHLRVFRAIGKEGALMAHYSNTQGGERE